MSTTVLAILSILAGFAAGAIVVAAYAYGSNDRQNSEVDLPDDSDTAELPPGGRGGGGSSSGDDHTDTLSGTTEPLEESPSEAPPREASGASQTDTLTGSDGVTISDETAVISQDEIESLVVGDSDEEQAYLVVVSGNRVGEMLKVDHDLVLGRNPDRADVSFRDRTVSSQHARLRRAQERTIIEDLDSANGTYVNAERIKRCQLSDGDKITLGRTTVLKFTFQDELDEEFQQQMYESSTRDQLTGAMTKTHFLDRMESELSYASRHGTNLCVVMFDLDHFKRINDTYGHVAGDQILRELGEIIPAVTRDESMFARYGGEEFAIAERNAGIEAGEKIAERIRQNVANRKFDVGDEVIDLTLSFGVTDLRFVDQPSVSALIKSADEALYRAKDAGRNRVVTASN